jgi:glycosyltransferase involved in cell wall biosynthesis
MFHEPFFYFGYQTLRRNALALVHRLMAIVLLAATRVAYLSSPTWEMFLRPYSWFRRIEMRWLPVSATIPYRRNLQGVAAFRRQFTNGNLAITVVGHFGTYASDTAPRVTECFAKLLGRRSDAIALCLGANGDVYANQLAATHPELRGRVFGPGFRSVDEVSLLLQACHIVIQPYADGVTSRRTSVMAPLANGVPVVTTTGHLTEGLWNLNDAVALAPTDDADALVAAAVALIEDDGARQALGRRGRAFYTKHFAAERAVEVLHGGQVERPEHSDPVLRPTSRITLPLQDV